MKLWKKILLGVALLVLAAGGLMAWKIGPRNIIGMLRYDQRQEGRLKVGDRARFLTVYIKEAHPLDEWQVESNEKESVCYPQPTTSGQRLSIANDFVKRFHWEIPLAVDPIENPANAAYAGWPERLYVVDEKGVIVYKGKPGPFGYHPEEVEAWLAVRFKS